MATSLLCSLHGSARSLLSELDDAGNASYNVMKELLMKRFGPVRHAEVHEQALQEIHLGRGQPIRELTHEILRLCKRAYLDFSADARNRMAIKALINAIGDKDTIFYISDKSPSTLDDVCSNYECYHVLTGSRHPRTTVKGMKSTEDKDADRQKQVPKEDEVLSSLRRRYENTTQQHQQLTSAVNQLLMRCPATCTAALAVGHSAGVSTCCRQLLASS